MKIRYELIYLYTDKEILMEIQILNFIQQFRSPAGDALMRFFTFLGDKGLIMILATLIFILYRRTRIVGHSMAAALILDALVCNLIIKPLVARPRPFTVNTSIQLLIRKPMDYSFPSGHTAACFALVTALYLSGYKKCSYVAGVIACLITFSRMYLYVHYPTDVLGGLIIGICCGFFGVWSSKVYLEKKASRTHVKTKG